VAPFDEAQFEYRCGDGKGKKKESKEKNVPTSNLPKFIRSPKQLKLRH
jgi:hypothetical protein